jgi:S1-C subfamily serine protease
MRYFIAVLALVLFPGMVFSQESEPSLQKILFKITATVRQPVPVEPWKKTPPQEMSGTGFLIAGQRIMTNAHMVRHASQIYVQPDKSDQQYPAIVEFVSQDIDLAILKLEDPAILQGLEPLPFNDGLPVIRSEVTVYGYPLGGNQLSVTKGIVSRVEYSQYELFRAALRMQIDAAVNKGNSGGPVLSNGKVVGVVFSGLGGADNIGYVIPSDEVKVFLDDVADGKSDGRGYLWIEASTVENVALRERLKLPDATGGVRVSKVLPQDSEFPIRPDDVITKIGPHTLNAYGEIAADGLSLNFRYYVPRVVQDGKVPLTLCRDGQSIEVNVPVTKLPPLAIKPLGDGYPNYAIVGSLVFETLTTEICLAFSSSPEVRAVSQWRGSPILEDIRRPPKYDGQELVFIAATFPSRLMKGYSRPIYCTVAKVNGTEVRNLRQLVEYLRDCKDEYLRFSFYEHDTEELTFKRKDFIDSTEEILSDNNIRKQFSDDLEDLWDKG